MHEKLVLNEDNESRTRIGAHHDHAMLLKEFHTIFEVFQVQSQS